MRILVFLSVYLIIREIILNTLSTGKQREIILNSLSTGKQIDNSLSTGTGRCHYIIMQASCARTSCARTSSVLLSSDSERGW